jgi:hypothetical protein
VLSIFVRARGGGALRLCCAPLPSPARGLATLRAVVLEPWIGRALGEAPWVRPHSLNHHQSSGARRLVRPEPSVSRQAVCGAGPHEGVAPERLLRAPSVATRAPWRASSHAYVSCSRHLFERRVGPLAGQLAVSYAATAPAAAFQVCRRACAPDATPADRHRTPPGATRPVAKSGKATTAKAPSSPWESAAATRRCPPPAAPASLPATPGRECRALRFRRNGSCGPRRRSVHRHLRCWP